MRVLVLCNSRIQALGEDRTFLCEIAAIARVSYSATRRLMACDRQASAAFCRRSRCDGLTEMHLREDRLRLLLTGLVEASRFGFRGEDVKGAYAVLRVFWVVAIAAAGYHWLVAQRRKHESQNKKLGEEKCH